MIKYSLMSGCGRVMNVLRMADAVVCVVWSMKTYWVVLFEFQFCKLHTN